MRNVGKIMLAHDRKNICGRIANYKLIMKSARKGEYVIAVFYDGERSFRRILGKISDVVMIYELIVQNDVTPCTLGDVIDDFTYPNV